jgi:AAA15 family ATPase/GTPase
MESKHLTYFKVENFKRLDSFEMNDIGQFNLIVGDNNVGKTTVLEALLFNTETKKYVLNLLFSLETRKILLSELDISNLFNYFFSLKTEKKHINYYYRTILNEDNHVSFLVSKIEELNSEELSAVQHKIIANPKVKDVIKMQVNGNAIIEFPPALERGYVPFVPVNSGYSIDINDFYSEITQKSKKHKTQLIQDLNSFIDNVVNIEISTSIVQNSNFLIVWITDYEKPLPVTMFGEGTIKLLRILLEIIMCNGGRVMIDEIDTGIHHSRFKKFFRTILLAAKRNNVQLFATTHSKECLKYFKEVLEEVDLKEFQKDTRCIRLIESENKSVKSFTYDFQRFQFAIDQENELR